MGSRGLTLGTQAGSRGHIDCRPQQEATVSPEARGVRRGVQSQGLRAEGRAAREGRTGPRFPRKEGRQAGRLPSAGPKFSGAGAAGLTRSGTWRGDSGGDGRLPQQRGRFLRSTGDRPGLPCLQGRGGGRCWGLEFWSHGPAP